MQNGSCVSVYEDSAAGGVDAAQDVGINGISDEVSFPDLLQIVFLGAGRGWYETLGRLEWALGESFIEIFVRATGFFDESIGQGSDFGNAVLFVFVGQGSVISEQSSGGWQLDGYCEQEEGSQNEVGDS